MLARERSYTKIKRSEGRTKEEVEKGRCAFSSLCSSEAPSVPLPIQSVQQLLMEATGQARGEEGLRLRNDSTEAPSRLITLCYVSTKLCQAKQPLGVGGSCLWAKPAVCHHQHVT